MVRQAHHELVRRKALRYTLRMAFDCHSHVQFAAFEKDWKEVIDRSLAAGVSIINVGTQRDTSARAVEIANMYQKGVYAAIGLHPVHTTRSHHDENELGGGAAAKAFVSRGEEFDHAYYRKLADDPKVVALGECGLDYYRPTGDPAEYKKKQRAVFFEHVMIAQKTHKALMIHCRPSKGTDDAYEDLLGALQEWQFAADRAVLHFYVGSLTMTKKFLDAGFNFEFGGVITFARNYDEQIKLIPHDRILTETDAPYVSPEPYRGQRNEPVYVKEVVKKLAEIKGISISEVDRITTENAKRIFKII
jgi:TatD DNase family protein